MRCCLSLWLTILTGAYLSYPALAQEDSSKDLSYSEILSIKDAFSRLAKTRRDLTCFRVKVNHEGSLLKVDIYPINNVRVDDKKVTLNISPCGLGAMFIYDANGKLSQTIYTR